MRQRNPAQTVVITPRGPSLPDCSASVLLPDLDDQLEVCASVPSGLPDPQSGKPGLVIRTAWCVTLSMTIPSLNAGKHVEVNRSQLLCSPVFNSNCEGKSVTSKDRPPAPALRSISDCQSAWRVQPVQMPDFLCEFDMAARATPPDALSDKDSSPETSATSFTFDTMKRCFRLRVHGNGLFDSKRFYPDKNESVVEPVGNHKDDTCAQRSFIHRARLSGRINNLNATEPYATHFYFPGQAAFLTLIAAPNSNFCLITISHELRDETLLQSTLAGASGQKVTSVDEGVRGSGSQCCIVLSPAVLRKATVCGKTMASLTAC